jgi:hypothetical protein
MLTSPECRARAEHYTSIRQQKSRRGHGIVAIRVSIGLMVVHYLSSTAIHTNDRQECSPPSWEGASLLILAILTQAHLVPISGKPEIGGRAPQDDGRWWVPRAWHRLSTLLPRRNKEATLPNHSKERDEAEARFKRAQKAIDDAKEAKAHYESEARAVREKTARLKALRLAKEAADLATQGDTKPITSKTTPSI